MGLLKTNKKLLMLLMIIMGKKRKVRKILDNATKNKF